MIAHRRYIAVETAISVAINGAISALMAWLVFGGRDRIPLGGGSGVLLDFVPQTFMIALMAVLVPTLITRNRVRAGRIGLGSPPRLRLPGNLLLRALAVALSATLIVGGSAALLMYGLHPDMIAFHPLLWLKIVYGMGLALLVTPIALAQALADRRDR
jgi:hypothetical protein